MRASLRIVAIVGLLMAGLAMAAVSTIGNIDQTARWMKSGFFVGTGSQASTASNQVTRVLGASAVIDFASSTIVCTDSSAISVPGAVAGDACSVGAPAAIAANSTFSCYVSATDNVKVRHCPAGTAIDPASATYFVRVISGQ